MPLEGLYSGLKGMRTSREGAASASSVAGHPLVLQGNHAGRQLWAAHVAAHVAPLQQPAPPRGPCAAAGRTAQSQALKPWMDTSAIGPPTPAVMWGCAAGCSLP